MKYRIMEREAFQVFGIGTLISRDAEKAFVQVPEFYRKCDDNPVPDEINSLLGRFHDNYTISAVFDNSETETAYMLCQFLPKGLKVPEKFTILDVPAATWAVFDAPDADVQALWRKIWEWFPDSGYESLEGVSFEMYYGLASHENGFGEIWIPVKKRNKRENRRIMSIWLKMMRLTFLC